jgi:putative DNA primase/helicase
MGSFEAWDDRVRSALLWAGEADPLQTRERIRAHADADVALLRELHEAWWRAFNVAGGTVALAIEQASGDNENASTLRNVLAQLDPRGGGKSFNPQAIGNRISALARRIIDGRRIERAGIVRGSTSWKVVRVGE